MQEINLTINGQKVTGKQGNTILEICRNNGIYVPTLCHLEGITDLGACRLCVVEIEGEKKINPACTYPARDGLVVKTHTEKLENYRRHILELLFAERNHFCMFCEQSGDCELQKLAYRYQMENVRYSNLFPEMRVDTLSDYLVMDHNRCILCGRCVRVCNVVANTHTLDFGGRGYKTVITADVNQPLGESTCTQCGACFQVCPTGAIMSKVSMYKGKTANCQQEPTICPGCGIGCEINALVKDNSIVRIESPLIASLRGGLCKIGRFGLIQDKPRRINAPLIRNQSGELEERSLEEAISKVSRKMVEINKDFGGVISPKCTSEAFSAFQELFKSSGDGPVNTLDARIYRLITRNLLSNGTFKDIDLPLESILEADFIMVIGGDIDKTHPVAGTLIRRTVRQNQAKLLVMDPLRDPFNFRSDIWLDPKQGTEDAVLNDIANRNNGYVDPASQTDKSAPERDEQLVSMMTGIDREKLKNAAQMFREARRTIIVCGNELFARNTRIAATLHNLTKHHKPNSSVGVIILKPAVNSRGAWSLGLAKEDFPATPPKGLYLVLSDDNIEEEEYRLFKGIDFLAVQASYESPITKIADVVLPSPIWAEREGTYTTTDGRTVKTNKVIQPRAGVLQDVEIIQKIQMEVKGGQG